MMLGQMYSQNSGLFHIFAVTVMKFLIGTSARKAGGGWEWTDVVDGDLLYLAKAAAFLFFQTAKQKQIRCALRFSLNTIHVLVSASDAGQILHSNVCYIIQICKIGDITTQNIQNLLNCSWLNKVQILSLPYHELNAMTKATQNAFHLFQHLNKEGIFVDVKNVMLLTDSATTIAQCNTQPVHLEAKFAHLVSRLTLILMQMGGSPQENIFFFQQKSKKRPNTGRIFIPDILTKCDINLTQQELCEGFQRDWLAAEGWMREPPTTWQHVTRGPLGTDTERGDGLKFNLYKKTTRDFLVDMKE